MADARKLTPTAETTGIRLRAGLLSRFISITACSDAALKPPLPRKPIRFEYNAVLSRCDQRGFPYPFFLDSVRCHA
ncbi:hypothetical protein [Paraburkholderia sp. PGU19]|uniref:hypothetical protein n=1 Tax=Paraburkholderia sp. PGU19 TaxID=2735434 RepID=UPI0015DA200B|nr:hypothetical protein [Paraburkholderia sp. PGU19]